MAEGSELIMLINFHGIESESGGSITSLDKPLVSLAIAANAESRATCPSVEGSIGQYVGEYCAGYSEGYRSLGNNHRNFDFLVYCEEVKCR